MASPRTSIRNSAPGPAAGQSGFTLIELLVVIGIFGILVGLTLITSLDSFRGYSFRSERDTVLSVLQRARSQSINNLCLGDTADCPSGRKHGVHFENGNYIIFQGDSYHDTPENAAVDEVIEPAYPMTFGPASLTDVVFDQLSGDVAAPGIIILSNGPEHTSTITINTEGQITWTN